MFKKLTILALAILFVWGMVAPKADALYGLEKFWFAVYDEQGDIIDSGTDNIDILVYDAGTTDKATIYSDDIATAKSQSSAWHPESSGLVAFYSAATTVDVTVANASYTVLKSGLTLYEHKVILINDTTLNGLDSVIIGANTAAAGTFTTLIGTAGSINGTVGATTPSTGAFTTLTASGSVVLGDANNDVITLMNAATLTEAASGSWAGSIWLTAPGDCKGGLVIENIAGATTGDYYGAYLIAKGAASAASGTLRALHTKAQANSGTLTQINGAYINADAKAATVGLLRGAEIKIENAPGSVATITKAVGLTIDAMFDTKSPTVGYGLEITNASGGLTSDICLSTGAFLMTGTGDPNGSVTAPNGSVYIRTGTGSADTCVYVNTDGSTAWTALGKGV